MPIWAHSDPTGLAPEAPGAQWQPLAVHLRNVAQLSRRLAESAAPEYTHFHDLAEWCGLLHDYGKYTDCFQEMILGAKRKCPHAIHGAAMAHAVLGATHVASAIAGHHGGMPDISVLADKVKKVREEAAALADRAAEELPALRDLLRGSPPKLENVLERFDLLTRMLLSCLVDADRLDTAGREIVQPPLDAPNRLRMLLTHFESLSTQGSERVVNTARAEVLEDCLRAADFDGPIFSLSVPTGGGKTLSSMAFALKRAALYPELYRRIIVVIPYLSIIEQNAEVYARIFGPDAILEHHSGSFAPLHKQDEDHFAIEKDQEASYRPPWQRPETENWDAPLIVTTSVRFFESLFSNHPSDLRRIHNIARSVVILDEVQVLPRPLLAPLLSMIDELARDWGCTFVLSTATKPAFEKPEAVGRRDVRWVHGKMREMQPILARPGIYGSPRVSPDGSRLALQLWEGQGQGRDVWIYDWQRDTMTRMTFSAGNLNPIWSPDGRYLIYSEGSGIFWTRSDGSGRPQPLIQRKELLFARAFTPDGKRLAFDGVTASLHYHIWTAPIDNEGGKLRAGMPEPFMQSNSDERFEAFSPDGRWLAYASDESGMFQIYVRQFPDRGGKWQISNGGGVLPVWSRNGRELFFRSEDGRTMMVAGYTAKGDSFVADKPRIWSEKPLGLALDNTLVPNYDVAPDGKRIVALMPADTPKSQRDQNHVIFLENFLDELRRRVPVTK